jgi:2-oxoglutarate ferredoxin oxidoreductase subunit delta
MGESDFTINERVEDVGRKPSRIVTYEDEFTRIEINESWCKGCELCVHFCPTETLQMKKLKSSVADLSKCIRCLDCEQRCPDFAITVFKLADKPKKRKDDA